ncbi:MAG: LamG domain-containing protein [Caulobacteraceae bacterium]|nr:LamG domain-containing protein [Caulobacteraceae bacterium]
MAYTFNGSTQYLSNNSSPLGNRPTTYTMACWVNGAAQDGRFIFCLGNSTTNNPVICIGTGATAASQNTSYARFFARSNNTSGTGEINLSGGPVLDSKWHHIAITWDNSEGKLYVDGTRVANGGSMGTPQDLNRIAIGAVLRSTAAGYFNGNIAECGMWNATANSSEIASLATGMTCDKVRPQSLVFYAHLVRELQDMRGGLTITNNSSATVANHPRVYA